MSNPAAWHPDPTGKHDHRWWDGERWTEHVADAGQAAVDPLGATAPPPPGGAEGPPAHAQGGWADGGATATGGPAGGEPGAQPAGATGGGPGSDEPPVWAQPQQGDQAPQDRPADQGWGGAQGGQGWQSGPPHEGQDWQGAQPGWQGGQGGPPVWQQGGGPRGGPSWEGGAPASSATDGMAIAAMVVGIIGILISWVPVLGAIVGIAALVLGFVARGRIKRTGAGGNGMAVTGIATGVVAIVINIAVIAFFVFAGEDLFQEIGSYAECIEETGDQELCERRLEEGLIDRFGR